MALDTATNYYVLLGVPQDADADSIRRAFRALVRRYHPDAGEGSSVEKFRQVLSAYETLNDPIRRGWYDRTLRPERVPVDVPVYIEPLLSRPAPEPLLSERRRDFNGRIAVSRSHPLDEMGDDLFRLWQAMCFAAAWRNRL